MYNNRKNNAFSINQIKLLLQKIASNSQVMKIQIQHYKDRRSALP